MKAITFSYDDGTTQDIRLIEIFNKYGLKATFNINSGLLGKENILVCNGIAVRHNKNKAEDIKHIYHGHEVAVHTLTHPNLTMIKDEREILKQVELDRQNLSELVQYEVYGMAYPCSNPNCDDRVAGIIRNNTNIKYSRTTLVTQSFEPYDNLYQYRGTLQHHKNWNILFEMGKQFLELKADTPKVFYIWGHSFEFDIYPERWNMFDEFCKMIANCKDIYYGTNLDVLKNFNEKGWGNEAG